MNREKLLEDAIFLEHSFLKVPLESTVKFYRLTLKSLEKEIQVIVYQIQQLTTKGLQKNDIIKEAKEYMNKLTILRNKFAEVKKMEREYLNVITDRLNHLKLPLLNRISLDNWYKIRLDRLLVDHLSRNGYDKTATAIVESSKLRNLTDIDIFQSINKITNSLAKKQCSVALKWCGTNRTKLAKLNSTLEFNLRIQEFVELVKKKKEKEAITYAKKNFPAYSLTNMAEIKRAMASLAFRNVNYYPYKDLYSDDRWNQLINQFKTDSFKLHSLTPSSILELYLRAGLTALKTERCFSEHTKNVNCPVCQPIYSEIAHSLPYSRRQHSTLVCKISGKFMNDDNPPMALPNGYVYSKEALEKLKNSNGEIVCPQTKQKFQWSELRKIYIT